MTSTRFVLLFLSTLLMGVYSVCDNTTCINTEGLCVGDFCACGSGLSGTDCTNMTTNCAGGWANITQLATGNYPTLDLVYSGIYGGNLLIRLTSPLVNNRSSTYIYLRDPLVYPNCALGAWTKTYAGCNEQYDLSVDWAVAATTCGFDVNTTDPNFIAYTNGLFVEDEDIVAEFRGSPVLRASTHNFPVLIKTQTRIAINTTVNINAPVRLLAAITKQSYNITSTTGILEFSTSLQWPFQLNGVSLIGQPNGLTINVLSLNTSCGNTFGNVCDQLYRLTIDPGQVCTLSGTYILNYTIACRGNQTLCPLDPNTNKASITGLIVSEQFCTPVDINIGLTGAVLIYDSASFTNQKVAFLPTQTAFFRAYLSTGSTATILSSSVVGVSVQLVAGGAEKVLRIVGQGNTAYGDAVSLTDVTSSAYNPSFSLVVNNDIFPVPVDGQLPFIVTVTIDVSYTTGARKRFVVVKRQVITDSQKTLLNALVQVAGSTSSSSPAATSAATTAATTAATSAATSSPTSSSTSNSPTGNTGTTGNTGNTATGTATGTGTSNPSPSPSPSSPPTQGSASASALAITALLVLAL